jgi:hypothetical protein
LHEQGSGAPDAEVVHGLLNHLVGTGEERRRDAEAEHIRRPEIYDQIEFGGLLCGFRRSRPRVPK